jgi:sulfur carrier protein ThiS
MSMVTITVSYDGRTAEAEGKTVGDAILHLGISPQTVLARLDGTFVPDDEPLKKGGKLELVRISSIG